MGVFVYLGMYIHIYIYMKASYVCIYACIGAYMYIYAYAHVYICGMYPHLCTLCACFCLHVHIYVHLRVFMSINVLQMLMVLYTLVYTQLWMCMHARYTAKTLFRYRTPSVEQENMRVRNMLTLRVQIHELRPCAPPKRHDMRTHVSLHLPHCSRHSLITHPLSVLLLTAIRQQRIIFFSHI
jgi:hypothetical protein